VNAPVQLLERVRGKYIRTAAGFWCRRSIPVGQSGPLISFTFDDFPRSALWTGGAILKRFGLSGTYYASFGLMGTRAPTGPIFEPEDLTLLAADGHELGCHTYAHCHSWETVPHVFEESIVKNREALESIVPGATFRTFSYPLSPPRVRTKQRVSTHFVCCRGGGQTFNRGTADLNYLHAYFLEKMRDRPEVVQELIEQNRQARGWLIFATHDVAERPTSFGCTPTFFEEIVQSAVKSGARVLPVVRAWEAVGASLSHSRVCQ
jgi:peptidoglycan/xylan/chitin deacetylase (PgdA/CDA1 family)